ncbi:DUF58 domain-containing protein [Engelhardtia mirabilis]|uniref:DUF58 domain-containing protein n=1 Tax=Engelhardtia mirabilis TaxID=2528011 RepID=A0A518BJY4_9BACT|nr:hypothetical protein Pla133_23660 [Planctomycetes bacterium Pla133]QDV01613.1 hypothetical protein Pla86_23650 [Planctomycetes bacterium Pla86]
MSADSERSRRVVFDVDLRRRFEAFSLRMDGARRRREGPGRSSHFGAGEEWAGFRPYRPGDDPRQLDWNLLARLDRPFTRITRREVSEQWVLLVDRSASMGVGEPGKLQASAELAAALVGLGLRRGARVTLLASGRPERRLSRRTDLADGLAWLEALTAGGDEGFGPGLRSEPVRRAGRVVAIGDLADASARALMELSRGGREVLLAQVLAPHELDPPLGPVRWVCPETGEALELAVDSNLRAEYERELNRELEGWRARCAVHGVRYLATSSARPFEDVALELFGGAP